MTNTTDERPGLPDKRKPKKKKSPPVEPKGGTLIRVAFGQGGGMQEVHQLHGLDAGAVVEAALDLLDR